MTHFREFVESHKDCVVYISVCNTFWEPSNKVHGKSVLYFFGDKKRLKLSWLLSTDHSSSLTNQARSKVCVYLFVHVGTELFVAECILCFLSSHMTSKGVIMLFLHDFHLKNLNLGYVQYISFIKKLSALRPVSELDIEIRIWLPSGQLLGYPLRKWVSSQKFW